MQGHAVVARNAAGEIRGILPLYQLCRTAGGRTLFMLGDGDACSDYVSVLARDQDAVEVARQIGQYLVATAADSQVGWDVIEIDGVVEGDEPMSVLANTMKQEGAAIHAHSRMSTWSRPASQSWDDHLQTHGKSQRRKMRSLCKALQDHDSLSQFSADSPQQVDQLLDALIQLHQRRWTEAGEQGSYANPKFRQFIRDTAIEFFRQGALYLTALRRDEQVIGVELNIIGDNRVLYSYSSGFDLDHSDVEPGRVLGVDTLQHLYRNDLVGIDYMRGDETYKQRMASESRQVFRFRAVAPAWYPRLRDAMWSTSFELAQFVRRRTGREPIAVLDISQPIAAPISTVK